MAQARYGMTTDVVTLEPSATIAETAQRMIEKEAAPVAGRRGGQVVAIVTGNHLLGVIGEADIRGDEAPRA